MENSSKDNTEQETQSISQQVDQQADQQANQQVDQQVDQQVSQQVDQQVNQLEQQSESIQTEEQKQEEYKRKQLIYLRMLSQCQRLNIEKLQSGAKELNNFVFPLYTDEILDKITSDIKEMSEAPTIQIIRHLPNNGITYYGDDLFIFEYLQDSSRFANDDELITYLAQYADLVTRSQHHTNWYKEQILTCNDLMTKEKQTIDFQTLANIAFYTDVIQDAQLKEQTKSLLLNLKSLAIQQFKEFKEQVQYIQQLLKSKDYQSYTDEQLEELAKSDQREKQQQS